MLSSSHSKVCIPCTTGAPAGVRRAAIGSMCIGLKSPVNAANRAWSVTVNIFESTRSPRLELPIKKFARTTHTHDRDWVFAEAFDAASRIGREVREILRRNLDS